jgi:hypothetical protein
VRGRMGMMGMVMVVVVMMMDTLLCWERISGVW